MVWIITQNKLDGIECDVKNMHESISFDQGKKKFFKDGKAYKAYKFRLLDDDGEVYYIGYSSNNSSFAPLDDYGMPNDGCTDIQYWEDGQWKSL